MCLNINRSFELKFYLLTLMELSDDTGPWRQVR